MSSTKKVIHMTVVIIATVAILPEIRGQEDDNMCYKDASDFIDKHIYNCDESRKNVWTPEDKEVVQDCDGKPHRFISKEWADRSYHKIDCLNDGAKCDEKTNTICKQEYRCTDWAFVQFGLGDTCANDEECLPGRLPFGWIKIKVENGCCCKDGPTQQDDVKEEDNKDNKVEDDKTN